MTGFTDADVPDQSGRTFVVTGANTGLGFEASSVLAARGARVLLACRSRDKAEAAMQRIRARTAAADLSFVALDQANLDSVRAAAEQIQQEPRLDVLVNNAGIMVPPRELTKDGFESQFGVNHLGTFALTGRLLGKLRGQPGSRVVSTASIAHYGGRIDFDDLNAEKSYDRIKRYRMSKIANLLFGYELQRRLEAAGAETISVICHPGVADTELPRYIPAPLRMFTPLVRPFFNTAAQGAWPTLMAATGPAVEGGGYYGPNGWREISGPAVRVDSNRHSKDPELARKLWDLSIEMTGVDPGL